MISAGGGGRHSRDKLESIAPVSVKRGDGNNKGVVGLSEAVEACKWLGLGEEVTEVFQVRKGGVGCGSDWRDEGKGRRPGPRFSPEQ